MSTVKQRQDSQVEKLSEDERKQLSAASRRQFLKIGVAAIGAFVLAGGGLQVLRLKKPDAPSQNHLPSQNPAFRCEPEPDGGWLCYTNDKVSGRRRVYRMNRVGAQIYQACNGQHSSEQIAETVASRLNLDAPGFLETTQTYLSVLEKYDLVVTHQKVNPFYNTVVRYERT